MRSFKKYICLFSIAILSVALLACGKKEESVINSDKVSFSYKVENKDEGQLKLEFNLAQNSPLVTYKIFENEKEISAGEIAEGDTKTIEVFTTQKSGEKYSYSLEVVDKLGNKVKKELSINLLEDTKVEEDDDDHDGDEVLEQPWDDKSKEYKKDEKVSFGGKVYECIQPHTSQADWTPEAAPSLWKEDK